MHFSLFVFACLFLFSGCELEPVVADDSEGEVKSTLDNGDLGDPSGWGKLSDYFSLDQPMDLKFHRYDDASYSTDFLFDPNEDTLRFRTFTEFEAVESQQASIYATLDTTETFAESFSDSLWVFSTLFKSVDSLVWNAADQVFISEQYYTKKLEREYTRDSSLVYFTDIFDSLIIYAQIDTSLSEGASILSQGTIILDTTTYTPKTSTQFGLNESGAENFQLSGTRVKAEMIMSRTNTDCNDNGAWDDAEEQLNDINGDGDSTDVLYEFSDLVNQEDSLRFYYNRIWDANEPKIADYNGDGDSTDIIFEFVDRGNELFDKAEPAITKSASWTRKNVFQDRNCNESWEATDELNLEDGSVEGDCLVLGGVWMTVGPDTFCDVGNYRYDAEEQYTEDPDGTAEITSDELYVQSEIMSSLLVDFLDPNNPKIMTTVVPGDSLTTRWGVKYTNLIESFTFYDTVAYVYDNVTSKKSVYSHPVIEYFTDNSGKTFYIAKAEWSDSGKDKYNYHLYRNEGANIAKLVYRDYFKPYGYWLPSQFEQRFWYDTLAVIDTIFYTYDGYLRDGEVYSKERAVSLSIPDELYADYLVEEKYEVSRESISIPMDGGLQIPANECFRVTRTEKTTMLGTGMTLIFINDTWLAKGRGIIRDQIQYQWYGLGQEGLSRLELFKDNSEGSESLGRKDFLKQTIDVDDFQLFDELGNDPYVHSKSGLIQSIGE